MKKELSDAEIFTMQDVWANPGCFAKDISFRLYEKYNWAPGTSYTLLGRCEKKGAVRRDKDGRWYPVVDKRDIQQQRIRQLADCLFDGSMAGMLCGFADFAQENGLSADELAQLNALVAKLEKKG